MAQVKRTVKLVTKQNVIDEPSEVEGFPMRSWSISIYLVGPDGDNLPAACFEKATYLLHESFGPKRSRQTFKQPPFTIREKGWGEFDMQITLTPVGNPKGGEQVLNHDLNFQQEVYESTHSVVRIISIIIAITTTTNTATCDTENEGCCEYHAH